MARIWWNKKTNRLYGWRASKYCVPVDDENETDRQELIKAGLLKPKNKELREWFKRNFPALASTVGLAGETPRPDYRKGKGENMVHLCKDNEQGVMGIITCRRCTDIVAAAKVIRKELKEKFPTVKFRVKSSRFSMGEAIDIFWVDGPPSRTIDIIVNRFADIDYDQFGDVLSGGNRYVNGHRTLSDETKKMLEETVKAKYVIENSYDLQSKMWQLSEELDLTQKAAT